MRKTVANFWKENLVPVDAIQIRQAMLLAAKKSEKAHFWEAHAEATAYAVKAIAFSFFSTFTYPVSAITGSILQLAHLELKLAKQHLTQETLNALRSLSLTTIGIVYVSFGFFLPKTIYPYFAPKKMPKSNPASSDKKKALQKQISTLNESCKIIEGKLGQEKGKVVEITRLKDEEKCAHEKIIAEKEFARALLQRQLEKKNSKLVELQKQIAQASQKATQQQLKMAADEKTIAEKESARALLQQQLEQEKSTLAGLQWQNTQDAQKVSQQHKTEISEKESAIKRLEQEVKKLRTASEKIPQIIQQADQLKKELQEQTALKRSFNQLQTQNTQLQSQFDDVQRQLQKLKKEEEFRKGQELEKRKQEEVIQNLDSLYKGLQECNTLFGEGTEIERIKRRNATLEKKIHGLQKENERLQQDLSKFPEHKKIRFVIERVLEQSLSQIERKIQQVKDDQVIQNLRREKEEIEDLQRRCQIYDEVLVQFENAPEEEKTEKKWRELFEQRQIPLNKFSIEPLPEVDVAQVLREFPNALHMNLAFDAVFVSGNFWQHVDDNHPVCFEENHLKILPAGSHEDIGKKAIQDFCCLLQKDGRGKVRVQVRLREKQGLTLQDIKQALHEIQKEKSILLKDDDVLIFDEKDNTIQKENGDAILGRKQAVQKFQALLIYTYGERLAAAVIARLRFVEKEELTWIDIKRALISVAAQVRASDLRQLFEDLKVDGRMLCKSNIQEKIDEFKGLKFEELTAGHFQILESAFRSIKIGPIQEDISQALASNISDFPTPEFARDWEVMEGRRICSFRPHNRYGESMTEEIFKDDDVHALTRRDKLPSVEELERLSDAEYWSTEIAYHQNSDPIDALGYTCKDGSVYSAKEGVFRVVGKIPDQNDGVAFYFYQPLHASQISVDASYPFIMTCRGADVKDPISLIRELDIKGIGKDSFKNRAKDTIETLLFHLNQIQHENVTFKIFGHGLGAVDMQRMLELLLSLMEEREKLKQESKAQNVRELEEQLKATKALDKIKKIEAIGFNPSAPEYSVSLSVRNLLFNRMIRSLLPLVLAKDYDHLDQEEIEVLQRIQVDLFSSKYQLESGINSPSEDLKLLGSIFEKKGIEEREFLRLDYIKFADRKIQKAGHRLVGTGCTSRCNTACPGCVLPLSTRTVYKLDPRMKKGEAKDFQAQRSKGFTGLNDSSIDYSLEILKDEGRTRRKLEIKLDLGKYGPVGSLDDLGSERIHNKDASLLLNWVLSHPPQQPMQEKVETEQQKIIGSIVNYLYRAREVPLQQISV